MFFFQNRIVLKKQNLLQKNIRFKNELFFRNKFFTQNKFLFSKKILVEIHLPKRDDPSSSQEKFPHSPAKVTFLASS